MLKKGFFLIILSCLLLLFPPVNTSLLSLVEAEHKTIRVPTDYATIQEAINAAEPGDTVYVYNGTYYEHIVVNKTISLVGENPLTTILDGGGEIVPVIRIVKPNVNVSGFTVQNTASDWESYGISMWQTQEVMVEDNIITESYYGILLDNSTNCKIVDNKIMNNHVCGICLRDGSSYNSIIDNSITDNPTGIYIAEPSSQYNTFYRNNIINNTNQVSLLGGYNSWDNGAEGNYWSDYDGIDLNGDGIGDTGVPHLGVDYYPLMEPWSLKRKFNVTWNEQVYPVVVRCNSTVASFNFSYHLREISFNVTGPSGTVGFCNVTFSKELLHGAFTILIDGNRTDYFLTDNATHTSLHFTYTHITHHVKIIATPLHDIAVVSVVPSSNEVYEGQIVNVTVVVENNGNFTETFNVTAYANTTIIQTQTVSNLAPSNQTTLTFIWNTTGVSLGDYTIKAEASVVPGETYAANNVKVNGIVCVIPEFATWLSLFVILLLTTMIVILMKSINHPSKHFIQH